jgi:PAS domain S-box-containing protein
MRIGIKQTAWGALGLVILLLGLGVQQLLQQQLQISLEHQQQQVENRFNLLRNVLLETLRSGRFQELQEIVQEWGQRHPQVARLELTADNGYLLAEFSRDLGDQPRHRQQGVIEFGYQGRVTLDYHESLQPPYARHEQNLRIAILLLLLLAGLSAYLVYSLIRQHEESLRLQAVSQRLSQSNSNLQQHRALLQALMDAIPDPIWYQDRQSLIRGCNRAFEGLVGRQEKNLINRSYADILEDSLAQRLSAQDQLTLGDGQSRRNRQHLTRSDGREALFDIITTAYEIDDDGTLGLLSLAREVSQGPGQAQQPETGQ